MKSRTRRLKSRTRRLSKNRVNGKLVNNGSSVRVLYFLRNRGRAAEASLFYARRESVGVFYNCYF